MSDLQKTVAVAIKRLEGNGDLPLPSYHSADAAGMDVPAAVADETVIQPGQIELIPCGFAIALPPGFEAELRPRSGLAYKHGITMINSPGTIDADYRGQVMVPIINHGQSPYVISRGMRIAQMIIKAVPRTVWSEVDELPSTHRGEGGFGHTGA